MRFLDGIDAKQVAAVFINLFTFDQCEITRRSYNGEDEFGPEEVRKL